MPRIEEKALKTELAKHGFESVADERPRQDSPSALAFRNVYPNA